MVMVNISETYDLSTKIGKMGIVGIHTPRGSLIDKMWPGLVLQHKKFRFVKCDVAMACASMLPADPLQIGVEAGAIAPQDMFNPILYRAVSNDSMSQIQSYLIGAVDSGSAVPALDQGSVVDINDAAFTATDVPVDQFQIYYGLLADSDGWRKAMPQAGLQLTGLYPLVYQVVNQYGVFNVSGAQDMPSKVDASIRVPGVDCNSITTYLADAHSFRGPSMRMPAVDCVWYNERENYSKDVVPNELCWVTSNTGKVPPAYVALIILPPAKLNQLYYRLKVTWTIEFTGLRSMTDLAKWNSLAFLGATSYGTDYAEQSASMTNTTAMVDTSGTTIEKIMEGA